MRLHIIESGLFKLDGGAMFGVVPKKLWQRINPPDENNLCTWSLRCLLVETEGRKILIDTGMGDKQDAKFRSFFHPHGDNTLVSSLEKKGFAPEDITDVFITHFHFDHVGGAVKYDDQGKLVPTFPNATYWSNKRHYDWAMDPNPREKASFLKENFEPLMEAGVLKFIEVSEQDVNWLPNIDIRYVYGHTEAMMLPILKGKEKTLVYCADLLPSSGHLGGPYVMSYDLRPLDTMEEKSRLLGEALEDDFLLFFEHDPAATCIKVVKNEKGRIVIGEHVDVDGVIL
jgi:glyoxylase-like metal-dependent hydrolase (beta-lactamase superfamily II)